MFNFTRYLLRKDFIRPLTDFNRESRMAHLLGLPINNGYESLGAQAND
jgi:hypothetical protein